MAPKRWDGWKSSIRKQRLEQEEFQHENTAPFTGTIHTQIQMPALDQQHTFGALFVLDENTPSQMINEVLKKVAEEEHDHLLWLANDSLANLPTIEGGGTTTELPIPSSWRSPFSGKTVEAAFEYLASIPLAYSGIRGYIAVLDKCLYEQSGWLVLYKIDECGEIISVPCTVGVAMVQIGLCDRDVWSLALANSLERLV